MDIQHQDKPQYPINVAELLGDLSFPASKMDIVAYLEDQNPDRRVFNMIHAITEKDYQSLDELNTELGKISDETAKVAPNQNTTES